MFKVVPSNQFKRDLKTAKRRGLNIESLRSVVNILASGKSLDKKYRDHALVGNWAGFRECHIAPDWLLIYKIENAELSLFLFRTGTHSDIFKK